METSQEEEEEFILLTKVKDWMRSFCKSSSSSRIALLDSPGDSIQLCVYPKESLLSFLPTFHVVFLEREADVDLRLLSYNEAVLLQETFLKDKLNLGRHSQILRLVSGSVLRLCSGLISNDVASEDVLLEAFSSKKVSRSATCLYILTKERDLCCQECLLLSSSPHYFEEDKVDALDEPFDNNTQPGDVADSDEDPSFNCPSSEEDDSYIPTSCKAKAKQRSPKNGLKKIEHCEICFSTFNSKSNLQVHMSSHESLQATLCEPCVCPICSEAISSRRELNTHIRRVHPEKGDMLCCFICYKFIKSLSNHLTGTHDTRTVICSKCGKSIKHRYYNEHLTQTHGAKKDRRVICPVCGKIICRMSNLSIHMKVMHSDESEKVLACEVCGKTFSHMKVLKKHFEVHQERKYKCKLCEYKTYRKSNVAVHLKKSHHMTDNVYSFVEDTSVSNQGT